jgi:hypothetical protein
MAAKPPKTFVELVKHIETILKAGEHFYVAYVNSQSDPVALSSLTLKEIRFAKRGRAVEATLLLDGAFKGRHGPHKFEASNIKLAELGITELVVGAGAVTLSTGKVIKGLSVKVAPGLLQASLADEVDRLTGLSTDRVREEAVKKVEQSKPYQEGLLRIKDLERQLARLTKQSEATKTRLERMTLRAVEKAQQKVVRGPAKTPYHVTVHKPKP